MYKCRNGIYTPHKEKLFKLKNGFFILYLHRQAVSFVPVHQLINRFVRQTIKARLLFCFLLTIVVHRSLTVHEIPGASRHPNSGHQKEPVLQELPHHATDND